MTKSLVSPGVNKDKLLIRPQSRLASQGDLASNWKHAERQPIFGSPSVHREHVSRSSYASLPCQVEDQETRRTIVMDPYIFWSCPTSSSKQTSTFHIRPAIMGKSGTLKVLGNWSVAAGIAWYSPRASPRHV